MIALISFIYTSTLRLKEFPVNYIINITVISNTNFPMVIL